LIHTWPRELSVANIRISSGATSLSCPPSLPDPVRVSNAPTYKPYAMGAKCGGKFMWVRRVFRSIVARASFTKRIRVPLLREVP
jgi:hypothetical protein